MSAKKEPQWGEWIEENGETNKWFPCHPGQWAILNSEARFLAAIAGTGGGKTRVGALWLMREIEKKPLGKYLIVVPKLAVLRQSTMPAWRETVAGYPLYDGEHKVQNSEYICPCGATIYLR